MINNNMENQIKNRFDKITQSKILKGAVISAVGAGALALLDFIGALEIDNALLASFIVWAMPSAINAIREYKKGIEAL